mmetsp:Transcript_14351/g.31099  ORF Transcript_14351/g.31099 Transcript_14351/m.31099 type:complete len:158 (-) Transcript_14351:131-604(-)|eukprot:CAMPEP_0172304834 /NCGR_PEP_ID=MMETSP1058-20130122/6208_1 /TAXON_ID=83371 /ORGANISM="Detonula confervacea, Strain CCMP 353" /LENGTH=157 /DNA_ID=CAMNT_0013016219 /DNA_START=27 /DNA_END=500 /DNA_ORIENTATION=-
MVKLIAIAAILSSVSTVAGVPGWFRNVPRGGTMYYNGLYPDALSNVVHGYAEVDKHNDESINDIHEVKSTSTKKDSLVSDEEYDEDPFFHALIHNNDGDSRVVNASSEPTSSDRVDNELFEKLHGKLFPHHDKDEREPKDKITYGIREVLEDSELFE